MYKSRLLKLLGSFHSTELQQLQLFLQSPYFQEKQSDELLFLFLHIKKYIAALDHAALEKKQTYEILYPGKTWVSGKLDKLMTQLLQATQRFVGIHFSESPANLELPLAKLLQERNLQANLDRVLNNWKKKIDAQTESTVENLHEKFLMEELMVKDQNKHLNPKIELQLPAMLESFDQYYVLMKLEYACQLLAVNLFAMPIDLGNSLESLDHLKSMMELPHLQLPAIQVYYHAYLVLCSTPEKRAEYFQEFNTLLYQHDAQLSETQRKSLHVLIRNYAVLQYHSGAEEYLQVVFDIYRDHLQRGFMYHEGKLLPFSFGNIVVFALRVKAYDWVLDFLESHKDKITGTEETPLIYQFNLAHYHFHRQNYEQAASLLPDHFKATYFKIAAKRLELKIFFETNSVLLESKIEAFKIFIYRLPSTQITLKQKKANNQFIQILRQILHPKTAVSCSRKEKIKAKIQDLGYISEKYWLLRIVDRRA